MRPASLAAAVASTLLLVSCGDDPTGPPESGPVASVEITPADVGFGALGSSVPLTATPRDAGGGAVDGDPIEWSVSDSAVLSVDPSSGLLTSAGVGQATVRATSGSAEGSLGVTVEQVPVSLELNAPATLGRVGASITLQPMAADSNGNAIQGAGSFAFASSDPDVVSVDDAGVLTANWLGSADVTVEGGELSEVTTVAVDVAGPGGPPVLGGEIACAAGQAAGFPCEGIDLVSYLPIGALGGKAGVELNDMWGWTDGATGREYVLVGRTDGLSFVDVTDPRQPRTLGQLPAATGPATWRDVKVHADHAYVVADGSPGHGVQVFDLTRLRDVERFTTFDEDARYDEVSSVHNIAINEETGFAYAVGSGAGGTTCGGGLHMIDLSSPGDPQFAGCFADPATGFANTGYTHDVQCVLYDGPDADYAGREICIGSNQTAISIADVTDKQNPVPVSRATYPDAGYVHQGWLTSDRAHFIQNDELDEINGVVASARMLVWDVTDLDDPVLVHEHLGPTGAVDHNVYVREDLAYQSNYHYGLRIIDVSSPVAPVEVGHFDTHPSDDAPGFDGSWSNFPWLSDGVVAVTSAEEGLFLLRRS